MSSKDFEEVNDHFDVEVQFFEEGADCNCHGLFNQAGLESRDHDSF